MIFVNRLIPRVARASRSPLCIIGAESNANGEFIQVASERIPGTDKAAFESDRRRVKAGSRVGPANPTDRRDPLGYSEGERNPRFPRRKIAA